MTLLFCLLQFIFTLTQNQADSKKTILNSIENGSKRKQTLEKKEFNISFSYSDKISDQSKPENRILFYSEISYTRNKSVRQRQNELEVRYTLGYTKANEWIRNSDLFKIQYKTAGLDKNVRNSLRKNTHSVTS